MVHAAVQLYTLREVDLPLPDLLARVREDGFEDVGPISLLDDRISLAPHFGHRQNDLANRGEQ